MNDVAYFNAAAVATAESRVRTGTTASQREREKREEESGQRGSRNVLFINVRRQAAVFTTTANAAAAAAAATTRGDRGRGGVIFMKTRRLVSCELLHLSSYIGE